MGLYSFISLSRSNQLNLREQIALRNVYVPMEESVIRRVENASVSMDLVDSIVLRSVKRYGRLPLSIDGYNMSM